MKKLREYINSTGFMLDVTLTMCLIAALIAREWVGFIGFSCAWMIRSSYPPLIEITLFDSEGKVVEIQTKEDKK